MVGTFKQFSNTLWKLVLPAFPGCCLQPIACPALAASCPKEAAAENCIQRPRKGHSSLLSYKPPNRLFVTSYWPKLYHYILYAKKKKKNQWQNSAISINDLGCSGSERVQASSEARGYPTPEQKLEGREKWPQPLNSEWQWWSTGFTTAACACKNTQSVF